MMNAARQFSAVHWPRTAAPRLPSGVLRRRCGGGLAADRRSRAPERERIDRATPQPAVPTYPARASALPSGVARGRNHGRWHPAAGKLLLATWCLTLGACSEITRTHQESRQQAEQRWDTVRGRIKLQLATETFNQGQLDEAQKQLAEAIALDPTMQESYILNTRILLERGEIAAAQEALKTALAQGADGAETDYLTGVIAQRYDQLDAALASYRRAAEREPRQAHYTAAVAETLVALGRPAEALQLIESRWTDFEHNATLRAAAGQIHMMMGRYEQAADVYRDAVRIAPEDITLQYQLGLVLSLAEKHGEALAVLAPLATRAQDPPAYILIALGRAHLGLHRSEEAMTALRRATQISPDTVAPWSWLARAALTAGDMVTARHAALRAADIEKNAADSHILLAYVCLRQGDRTAAVTALRVALQRQPDDPIALYLMERARDAAGPAGQRTRPTALQEVPTR